GEQAAAALAQAQAIDAEEQAASAELARHGAQLLSGTGRILTHCNTGMLAAPGRGTALAVIAELAQRGSLELVLATESRPLLQGARLTVWELVRLKIAHQLLVDSAAPGLIAAGGVGAGVVGWGSAAAEIPFVVAGPPSTIDPSCPTGAQIEIEERGEEEVRTVVTGGEPGRWELTLPGTRCRNPAFDLTP